jgi:hypothetical protein
MRGPALFTQISVSRALRAVKKSGVAARIEIGRNGAISIIPTEPAPIEPVAKATSWDETLWQAGLNISTLISTATASFGMTSGAAGSRACLCRDCRARSSSCEPIRMHLPA